MPGIGRGSECPAPLLLLEDPALSPQPAWTEPCLSESNISSVKVKYALAKDVRLSTQKAVQVDTHRGEVTLTGKVHTREQKEHAGIVADKVDGVVKVHNLLSVVPEQ